jgi:glycerol-1-phosphate dehydrogenase [NAD(P)+]
MTAAGYADLVSEVTAGADWIIADRLGIEAIHRQSWDMVQQDLRAWISRPEALRAGDQKAFADLFEGLTMNGFAMQAMRSSRPASGTEHLFSHVWEMEHLEAAGIPVSHGFKVAMGTLAATALMEVLLRREPATLDVEARCAAWPSWSDREQEVRSEFAGTPIVDDAVANSRSKWIDAGELRRRLDTLSRLWSDIAREVRAQLLPYDELVRVLKAADVPVRPSRVGLTRERIRTTFRRAHMIRPRFTALDLAYETGWLPDCLQEIFSGSRYLSE